ncbi:hypothetical protein R5R35_004964 [Gryllus longicercus]|uniref:Uncharacterized protein n=1 Tax=Gryllus longicercus TaxID=2509291 RepID=A0AAN9W2H5_9ORTH
MRALAGAINGPRSPQRRLRSFVARGQPLEGEAEALGSKTYISRIQESIRKLQDIQTMVFRRNREESR